MNDFAGVGMDVFEGISEADRRTYLLDVYQFKNADGTPKFPVLVPTTFDRFARKINVAVHSEE